VVSWGKTYKSSIGSEFSNSEKIRPNRKIVKQKEREEKKLVVSLFIGLLFPLENSKLDTIFLAAPIFIEKLFFYSCARQSRIKPFAYLPSLSSKISSVTKLSLLPFFTCTIPRETNSVPDFSEETFFCQKSL
jgi:hypothetical protein